MSRTTEPRDRAATPTTASLQAARAAHDAMAWLDAVAAFRAADADQPLGPDDLWRLGTAAHLTREDAVAREALERAHRSHLEAGDAAAAARTAFWLGMLLLQLGDHAPGLGWIGRAGALLDQHDLDVAERALLGIPGALQAVEGGDPEAGLAGFREVAAIADRFDDPDGRALGRLGQGRALLALGRIDEGVAMLDQAMVEVTTGDVWPIVTGIVYCAVIIACRDSFDMRRAREWTAALNRWCVEQQGLRPYRGQCLIHRSEVMQSGGDWAGAMQVVEEACAHLADPPGDPVMGMARYQQAELLRLRGAFEEAEEGYREASTWGHPVQPGLALLRLAQGRVDDAVAAIRRVVDERDGDLVGRCRALAASVEILLTAGEVDLARQAASELAEVAEDVETPYLHAVAASARGAVLLADGEHVEAGTVLRAAWRRWQQLDAPYEAARVRVQLARVCREAGDHDTAEMELDAARRVFEELGARPALAQVVGLSDDGDPGSPGGLTPREVEVLRLVATGATNREVANRLVISEKTVARHLSNMFTKLGITSRAAATAWAYEHDLV